MRLLPVCFVIAGISPLQAFDFNQQIVLPERATPAEQTAANELSHYLTLMRGGTVQILTEVNATGVSAGAIWLGPTRKAAALKRITDFTPDKTNLNSNPLLEYVSDSDAPSGYAVRLSPGANPGSYYSLPMICGLYSPNASETISGPGLSQAAIKGAGYHYYKLMDVTPVHNDSYFYILGDWTLQYPTVGEVVNTYGPNVHYEVWASIKFSGAAYPYGVAGEANGIFVERVFLVRDPTPLDFNSAQANLNGNPLLSVVAASDTESGQAVRLEPGANPHSNYVMPMKYGAYSASQGNPLGSGTLLSGSVPGPGYHYYKLLSFDAASDFYIYLFGDWALQYPMPNTVAENGPGKYSAWARLKFTGPSYPFGNLAEQNGIYVDRIILHDEAIAPVTLPAGNPNLNSNPNLSIVTDLGAPTGHAVQLLSGTNPGSSYAMPLTFGAYCPEIAQFQGSWSLDYANVVGAGYHDYILATFTPNANSFYLYFFGDWTLQYPMTNVLVTNSPNVSYKVMASIKFTGSAYPFGNPGDPNGIHIDNVRLVPTSK